MEIFVNNQKQDIPEGSTVETVLKKMNFTDRTGVAVAVNQKVVPRKDWKDKQVNQNDKILLITVTSGG